MKKHLVQAFAVAAFAVGGAGASLAKDMPTNSISCSQFTKLPSGAWHTAHAEFGFAQTKMVKLGPTVVTPHSLYINRHDFYPVLEQKCGSAK